MLISRSPLSWQSCFPCVSYFHVSTWRRLSSVDDDENATGLNQATWPCPGFAKHDHFWSRFCSSFDEKLTGTTTTMTTSSFTSTTSFTVTTTTSTTYTGTGSWGIGVYGLDDEAMLGSHWLKLQSHCNNCPAMLSVVRSIHLFNSFLRPRVLVLQGKDVNAWTLCNLWKCICVGESSWHLASKKPIQIDLGGPRYFLEMDGFTGRPYGIYATDEPLLTGLFLKMPRKYPMLGCWDVLGCFEF